MKFIDQLIRTNFIEVKVAHALASVDLWRYGLATCPRAVGSGYRSPISGYSQPAPESIGEEGHSRAGNSNDSNDIEHHPHFLGRIGDQLEIQG
jgi:hypothetical protein